MSRSVWKGKFIDISLLKRFFLCKLKVLDSNKVFHVWSRRSVIFPDLIGSFVDIYNGKRFVRVKIVESMVGHKFGEFSFSKRMGNTIHSGNQNVSKLSSNKGKIFSKKG